MTYVYNNINSFLRDYVSLKIKYQELNSNFYPHFETGVCRIYEEYLRNAYPSANAIEYKIEDLMDFIDTIPDITCLVFQRDNSLYAPHTKDWIKEQVYLLLKGQVRKQ